MKINEYVPLKPSVFRKVSNIIDELHEKEFCDVEGHGTVHPTQFEDRALTEQDLDKIKANSYGQYKLTPKLSDESLISRIENCLDNCQKMQGHIPRHYDEAVIHQYMPEILKRFKEIIENKE